MEDVVGYELLKLSKANVFLPSYVLEKPTALPAKVLWISGPWACLAKTLQRAKLPG